MAGVLIDVDGTLLKGPSSEVLFISYLVRRQRIGPRQVASAVLFVPRWGARFGRDVFKKNKAYLAGLDVDDVGELADEFVDDELEARLRPTLLERIERHRGVGDRIAVLTGTPEFIARALARRIGAEAWSATQCGTRNGSFTADPPEAHPFHREKIERSRELCQRLDCELGGCVAYGNSIYDLPLLRQVARPIAVCPDRRLGNAARSEGWETLNS